MSILRFHYLTELNTTFKFILQDRNSVMCNNSLMADVYFLVGSDFLSSQMGADTSSVTMPQKIPAHKLVLLIA